MLSDDFCKPSGLNVTFSGFPGQLRANFLDQYIDICWLGDVVVNLKPNRFQRGIESGVTCENKSDHFVPGAAHCTYHRETIARRANVEVRDEHIEFLLSDEAERLWHCSNAGHREAVFLEDQPQHDADIIFVVHEEDSGLLLWHIRRIRCGLRCLREDVQSISTGRCFESYQFAALAACGTVAGTNSFPAPLIV